MFGMTLCLFVTWKLGTAISGRGHSIFVIINLFFIILFFELGGGGALSSTCD